MSLRCAKLVGGRVSSRLEDSRVHSIACLGTCFQTANEQKMRPLGVHSKRLFENRNTAQ